MRRWLTAAVLVAALGLAACRSTPPPGAPGAALKTDGATLLAYDFGDDQAARQALQAVAAQAAHIDGAREIYRVLWVQTTQGEVEAVQGSHSIEAAVPVCWLLLWGSFQPTGNVGQSERYDGARGFTFRLERLRGAQVQNHHGAFDYRLSADDPADRPELGRLPAGARRRSARPTAA